MFIVIGIVVFAAQVAVYALVKRHKANSAASARMHRAIHRVEPVARIIVPHAHNKFGDN